MPGPSIWGGKQLLTAVECRKVSERAVDSAVKRLLHLIDRTKPSRSESSSGGDTPESRELTRRVATDSIVLLKNKNNILPLRRDGNTTYGFIGEHFDNPATSGGGSSKTTPFYVSRPLDTFTEILGSQKVSYEPGCYSEFLARYES